MIAAEEVLYAQNHEEAFTELLNRNRKFLLINAFRACGRYITTGDDEYSVAIRAFYEAVRSWDKEKGSFASFSALVIRRRLQDFQKSRTKYQAEIYVPGAVLDGEINDDDGPLELEIRRKLSEETLTGREAEVRIEIEEIQILLQEYGFSFFDLSECAPKARKTKTACGQLIRELAGDASLMAEMRRTKTLPASQLCRKCGVSGKIAERHRKYIIAAAEILCGDWPHLKEYIPYSRQGENA